MNRTPRTKLVEGDVVEIETPKGLAYGSSPIGIRSMAN